MTPEPDSPAEALTLAEILAGFEADGYTTEFGATDDCLLKCFSCGATTAPEAAAIDRLSRTEGASDPDDMLAIVAIRCDHCGAMGTAVFNYGPETPPEQAEVL